MRALPSLITYQVSECSIALNGRSWPTSNGGGDSTSTKYRKRIVPRAASCSTMKKFSAYISVLTIAWMPRSTSGMSRSEPARSEIANSARCRFSERSSCSCESCSSAHSSARRRCWPASCNGTSSSAKKPASACAGCSCSSNTAGSGFAHSRIATRWRSGCQCGPSPWLAAASHGPSAAANGAGPGPAATPSSPHSTLAATQPGLAWASAAIASATSSGVCATISRASHPSCNDPSRGVGSTASACFIVGAPPRPGSANADWPASFQRVRHIGIGLC